MCCSVETQGSSTVLRHETMNSQKNVDTFGWVVTLLSLGLYLLSCSNGAFANHLRGENSNTQSLQPEENHRQVSSCVTDKFQGYSIQW